MVSSIIFYWIIVYHCLKNKPEEKNLTNNNIINTDDSLSQEDIDSIKKMDKNKNVYSYTAYRCCGYFCYSVTIDKRGKKSCCEKFGECIKDFCLLSFKSFVDCFNVTFCFILNQILCRGDDIYKCCCKCENIKYNKISENFCFFYKEERKYRWFHDYITSDVQKNIAPYVLEYILLGLIILAFDKKFIDYKVNIQNIFEEDFSFAEGLNEAKKWIIMFSTLFVFFWFSGKFGKVKLQETDNNKKINYNESYFIFNGLHIMLLINSIISITFSILYLSGITYFDDYFLIPILIYQYFYFSINYYCICVSEQKNDRQIIFSGAILVTIYIKTWDFIYTLIKDSIELEKEMYIIQMSLSIIILSFFIYYLICSDIKYTICESCINYSLCSCCQSLCSCCIYDIYCMDGTQYCDCCCCFYSSCCYCEECDRYCFSCKCCKSRDEIRIH